MSGRTWLWLAGAAVALTAAAGCGDNHGQGDDVPPGADAAPGDSGTEDGSIPVVIVTDEDGAPVTRLELRATPLGQRAAAVLRVANAGAAATGPIALAIAGPDAADYALDGAGTTCSGAALDPGATCDVAITFTPAATGERRATLSIESAPGGAAEVELVAQGLAPLLVLEPPAFDFGSHGAGSDASTVLHVRNTGGAAAQLDAIAVTGDPDFTRGLSTCGAALAPGASCDIAVRLQPQAIGARAASLVVSSGGTDYTAALAGTGPSRSPGASAGASRSTPPAA